MSSIFSPARLSSFGTANTGPMPISSGSQPAIWKPRKTSLWGIPSWSARWRDINSVADAPSESWEELPAVTVPWPLFGSKCGFKASNPASVVSGRLHSSRSAHTSSLPITSPVFLSRMARVTRIGDFLFEKAIALSARRALLAQKGILILRQPANLISFGHNFGGYSHDHVQPRHPLQQLRIGVVVTWRHADALDAASDDRLLAFVDDLMRSQGNRLQTRGAEPIDCHAGDRCRQVGQHRRDAGDVLPL